MIAICLIASIHLYVVVAESMCPISKGSTPNLESIFIGKCNNFIKVVERTNCDVANINCNAIWNEFYSAIVGKDPCQITPDSFHRLLDVGRHPIRNDRSMFWSGTKGFAHQISKTFGYSSLEDTLIGYITDDLQFCSSRNQSWFSTSVCQEECVTRNNPFWTAASIDFARRAQGRSVVVLNATRQRGGALYNRSIFYRYEVPNLIQGQLTELRVVLLGDPGEERFESCRDPKTIHHLEQLLREKNIKYSCQDDALDSVDLRYLMCFRQPWLKWCQHLSGVNNSRSIFQFLLFKFAVLSLLINFCMFE